MKNIIVVLGVIVLFMLPSCYTNVIESEDFVPDPNSSDSVPSPGNNEEGIDYLADALPFLFETLSECENISDADKNLQQIKEFQGVEDAWTEGDELYVAIKGWETMGFTFPHEEDTSEEMDEESSQTKTAVKAMDTRMETAVRPNEEMLKTAFANQQYNDEQAQNNIHISKPGLSFFSQSLEHIKGWETMSFSSPYDNLSEAGVENLSRGLKARSMIAKKDAAVRTEGKTLTAVIANQQYYDQRCKQHIEDYTRLEEQLKSCGIKTKTINNPGLSFFANDIFEYDLVFLVTHGGYTAKYGSHILLTGDEYAQVPKKRWYNFFRKDEKEVKKEKSDEVKAYLNSLREKYNATEDHIRGDWAVEIRGGDTCWVFRPFITEKFISEKVNRKFQNPYSIFFNTACKSLKVNNALADAFFTKGLGVYLGYDESNGVGKKAGPAFFESLLNGFSVENAYNALPANYRSEYKRYYNWVEMKDEYYLANLKYLISPTAQKEKDIFLFQTISVKKEQEEVENQFISEQTAIIEGHFTSLNPEELTFGFFIGETEDDLREIPVPREYLGDMPDNNEFIMRGAFDNEDLETNEYYYYCSYTYDGHSYNCGDTLLYIMPTTSLLSCPDDNHPHAIDMGLPSGIKWACCNIGSSSPEGFGGYYAWGETEEKDNYDYTTYSHYGKSIGDDISGTQYDVAHKKWGGSWLMPSLERYSELNLNCMKFWGIHNGNKGIYIIGPNGSEIFMPAAGDRKEGSTRNVGTRGSYWTSSWMLTSMWGFGIPYEFYFDPGNSYCGFSENDDNLGAYGKTVRAVCP